MRIVDAGENEPTQNHDSSSSDLGLIVDRGGAAAVDGGCCPVPYQVISSRERAVFFFSLFHLAFLRWVAERRVGGQPQCLHTHPILSTVPAFDRK